MNPTYIQNHLSHLLEPELIAKISREGTQAILEVGDRDKGYKPAAIVC